MTDVFLAFDGVNPPSSADVVINISAEAIAGDVIVSVIGVSPGSSSNNYNNMFSPVIPENGKIVQKSGGVDLSSVRFLLRVQRVD